MPRTDIHPLDTIDAIEQQMTARHTQRTRDAEIAAIHTAMHETVRSGYVANWQHVDAITRQRWLEHFAQFVPVAALLLSLMMTLTLAVVAGAVL